MPKDRLYTAFHETFSLNLPAITSIVNLSLEKNGAITPAIVRKETTLGNNYIKAMPRYARGCGLLEMGDYRLTPLGEIVCQHDPNLSQLSTLWLMHYHLSAPHGPGPVFWSHLVAHSLPFGKTITREGLSADLTRFLTSQSDGGSLGERTVRSTLTVFLGTYMKSDGLGRLGLLTPTGGKARDSVLVSEPQSPPLGVVAYALADYWEAQYGEQVGVSMSELARDGGFARLMWMDRQRLEDALEALRRERVLDLYRQAPPHQVVRMWSSKQDLLVRLYD